MRRDKFHPLTFLTVLTLTFLAANAAATPITQTEKDALAVLGNADSSLEAKAMACDRLGAVGTAEAVPVLAELLADEKLHDYSRDALERIADPAAGEALLASLETLKGSLRVGVINTLGDRGDAAAVPALQKIAAGENPVAADAALSSLGIIATDEAVATILSVLKNGDGKMKLAAAHAALKAAEHSAKAAELRGAVAAADVPGHLKEAAAGK